MPARCVVTCFRNWISVFPDHFQVQAASTDAFDRVVAQHGVHPPALLILSTPHLTTGTRSSFVNGVKQVGRAVGQVHPPHPDPGHEPLAAEQSVRQVPGAVLGGIKSTVATLMRASHDNDDDEHSGVGAPSGVGLWGSKHHAAVEEEEGMDALEYNENALDGGGPHCVQQVCNMTCDLCGIERAKDGNSRYSCE